MLDWSLLPKDLLERINDRFDTCFENVHFRSVCRLWRSAVPSPSYTRGLGFISLLPIFNDNPLFEGDKQCILKKVPIFLLRFHTPFDADYMLIGMSKTKSGKQKLLWPLVDDSSSSDYGITMNTLGSQIIPLGHTYKIKFYAKTTRRYKTLGEGITIRVVFVQLQNGRDFVVVARVFGDLLMYRSLDNKWTKIDCRIKAYRDMVSFKGKFYVVDMSGHGHVCVIEPSLKVSEVHSVTPCHKSCKETLVVSSDELLLVQQFTLGEYNHIWFRLFRLEEEFQRRWVRVHDLEDRVVFLGNEWSFCYSAKELPGMKGNCVVFFEPDSTFERLLVFDLGTKKTSNALTECIGSMGAFCENRDSVLRCGILAPSNPTYRLYDSSSESE